MEKNIIYRAPFVVTGKGPVLEDGAVLVSNNTIIGVDRFERLKSESSEIVDCEGYVLTPALINCHAHLELSWMADHESTCDTFEPGDITGWIRGLLKMRDHFSPSDDEIDRAASKALDLLYTNGTALVGDIGNRDASRHIGFEHRIEVLFYLEMMGLTNNAAQQQINRLSELDFAVTGHGPYSSHPDLIQVLHRRAVERLDVFPLHIAETYDEIDLLQTGKGRFYEFLNERLKQIGEYEGKDLSDFFTPPGCGAVEYLDRLGVLDKDTLCVHTVHVNEHEVDLIAEKKAKVCLCPRSNAHIGVGVAPVEKFLARDILPGLGTDSLVSNTTLSIFAEMSMLAKDHPNIDPETIFAMATIGGAQALNRSDQFGSMEKGKSASVLAVEVGDIVLGDVCSFLVHTGQEVNVTWLEDFNA